MDPEMHPLLRRANQLSAETSGYEPLTIDQRMSMGQQRDANTGVVPYITNALNGLSRGLTQVVELPYNIVNNAPQLYNLVPGAKDLAGVDHFGKLSEMGMPPFKQMGDDPLIDAVGKYYPGMDHVGGISQPNPEYPITNRIMEDIGTGIGTMGAGALETGAKGLAGVFSKYLGKPLMETPGRAIAGQVAGAVGSEGGRWAADEAGVENPVGRFAMQMAGSMAPTGITDLAEAGAKKLLSKPGGQATVEAMDRLNIRPSIGLTGNQNASQLENAAAILPFFGSVSKNVQAGQIDEFGNVVKDTAAKIRPNGATPRADEIMLGEQVGDIAKGGLNRMKEGFGQREDALMSAIGPRTPIDLTNTRQAIADMIPRVDPEMQAALQHELQLLDDMVIKNKTVTQQTTSKASSILDETGNPITTDVTQPVESITATNTVPYEQFRSWRTNVGRRTDQPSIKGGQSKQLYGAITKDLEGAADQAGVGDDFRNLMNEQRIAHDDTLSMADGGDIPAMEKLSTGQSERGKTFFKQSVGNPDRVALLKRNATPEQWQQFAGDTLEHLGIARDSAQGAVGDLVSPNTFLTNWNKMDPRTKIMLFDDGQGTLQTLDDLAVVAEAMKQRGNASNFSNTAGVGMSAGALAKAGAAIGTAGAGAGTGAALAGLPGAAAGAGITYAMVKTLMSETMARWAANQGIPIMDKVKSQAMTGAAMAGNTSETQPIRKKK